MLKKREAVTRSIYVTGNRPCNRDSFLVNNGGWIVVALRTPEKYSFVSVAKLFAYTGGGRNLLVTFCCF